MANQERAAILERIIADTPQAYQAQAAAFTKSAEQLGISPRTLEKLFRLGRKHTDNHTYDFRNLTNIVFTGNDRDGTYTSTTGHTYRYGPRFRNKHDQEHQPGQGMGWETGLKFNESLLRAGLQESAGLPRTDEKAMATRDELRRRKKDYLQSLDQALQEKELVKDIQSVNERRKVRALIGLDDAIKEASNGLYDGIGAFLNSKDFYNEHMRDIMELLLPKGGVIRRLKARNDLPGTIKEHLRTVTAYGRYMTPEERDDYLTKLEAFDQETALLDMKGHAERYVHDLQDLAEERDLEERPEALLNVLAQLQAEQPVGTAESIAAFVQLYDVHGKRVERYEQHVRRSEAYLKDYHAGEETLRPVFIDGPVWKGGKDDTIPSEISASLEGIVKQRGDPFLKEAQRWFLNEYAAGSAEHNVATQSMRETKRETDAVVILQRRRKAKEGGRELIDDRHRVAEDFSDAYAIGLDEFIRRMEDQRRFSHHKTGDWKKESETIKAEADAGLYVDERFSTFRGMIPVLRDEFIPYGREEQRAVEEYRDLQRKARVLKGVWVEELYFSAGESYIDEAAAGKAKAIVKEQSLRVNDAYERLELRTREAMRDDLITALPRAFEEASLTSNEHYEVTLKGVLFEEKDNLKRAVGARWNPEQKQWYLETQKACLADKLEAIKEFNKDHKGRITLAIT
ncbi:hypothetical protein JXA12_00765 [Candidatus Woesearchaeota archaeon]|nr:hypothetical protein [Candidatus Woesearchaeota archaeon]